jgi:hypothetical protein
MTRIGITGHRGLPPSTVELVDGALRVEIAKYPADDLVGVSCIADGADALFAQAILDHGGQLEVIVPADEYRAGLPTDHHPTYDHLFAAATTVHRLPYRESTSEAHMVASEHMLDHIDHLIAVWDGQPARGHGGTADVVNTARRCGLSVTIVWPDAARRD